MEFVPYVIHIAKFTFSIIPFQINITTNFYRKFMIRCSVPNKSIFQRITNSY